MKRIQLIILTFIITLSLSLGANAIAKNGKPVVKPPVTVQKSVASTEKHYEKANPLDIVANPSKYLNKRVTIRAPFDKFTTLGLDYKPAFRSSEKYITFLIKRTDVINHVVPLSEMKNFIDRKLAEKYIDLKPGDDIEYSGIVFSNALSDVWIEVEQFTVLSPKSEGKTPDKK